MKILNKLFKREKINGGELCPTYMFRWTLLRWRGRAVYIHRFVADDWSMDLHDHPKRFISIGLRGGYLEQTPGGFRHFKAPWIRSFPAEHTHRISLIGCRECWTLVIVLKSVRPWGFWHLGKWIPWRRYINSDAAKSAKACE